MDLTVLSSILTAIVGLLAIFGGVYWKKFNNLLKESAEMVVALSVFIGDLRTALKPNGDGKVEITEEEARSLVEKYESLRKEFKDVIQVFKSGVSK